MEMFAEETISRLGNARYTGSGHHKSKPADYGFVPPVSPRSDKSLCDDLRPIPFREARSLFHSGICLGMISNPLEHGLPKYVWAVDDGGEAYEAKLGGDGRSYHGYRLYRDERMRDYIVDTWNERQRQS